MSLKTVKSSLLLFLVMLSACQQAQDAEPKPLIAKCTHAVGLCNLPLFISHEDQTTKDLGIFINLINIPNWADHPAALTAGRVDFSVTPFTNVMTAFSNGAPIKVVAGSGMNGLFLLGARDIKTAEDLRGKRIGTFQADTLEMLLYSFLKQNQIPWSEVEVVYFTDAFELINAFSRGGVDAMTHVEPYATRAVTEFSARKLADGVSVWGGDHPDCVLTASERVIRENPKLVKGIILGMLRAELEIEQDTEAAVKKAVGKYYKADLADILAAAKAQPPGIDIRNKTQFMFARYEDLKTLNYVTKSRDPRGLFDFHLLQEVIKENKELYQKLRVKAQA